MCSASQTVICMGRGGFDEQHIEENLCPTLNCTHDGVPAVVTERSNK